MSETKLTNRGKHKVMTGNGGLEMKNKEFWTLRFSRGCTEDGDSAGLRVRILWIPSILPLT